MQGRRGATAWCGRLLLFAALVLGIVTMHTLGHPRGHDGGAHAPSQAMAASMTHEAPGRPSAPAAASPSTHTPHASHAGDPAHGGGMDPMSVCLAVLGAGAAAVLLLSLAAAGHLAGAVPVAARAWFSRSLWPVPPPRRKALARLSVLRV
ncbi:hypothetical protein J1792_29405 [Streptomyces triculaminicus]|uniref:Uncharacterized protein n=2 Tax=Streptomyces TaxID=1883 RepID=A0A939JTA2_9ACTN|nr:MULTISPECIES: DUF6153 family protein [Streptomyces]MBO0656712.1 hypothetical protein [Streptomyces triculaminicus]QSY47845.1 hypothetical protein J3S04_21665 [Streptomyces griseocarneus]